MGLIVLKTKLFLFSNSLFAEVIFSNLMSGGFDLDASFEEELKRQPYSIRIWCAYIGSKSDGNGSSGQKRDVRWALYKRALKLMPRCYKLWYAYLSERVENARDDPSVEKYKQVRSVEFRKNET